MLVRDYFAKWNGKGYDIDGVYGIQCVDFFKIFCQEFFGTYTATPNNWADGYYKYYDDEAFIKEHFQRIPGTSFENGDWVFFPYGSNAAPHSHVCMYYNGLAFGTNQGGNNTPANLVEIDWSQALGALRPIGVWEEPSGTSIEDLAVAVIRGDYGNGDERREKLGSMYDEVQAKVNEMLSEDSHPDIDAMAEAVIRGDYGNGEERRERLGSLYDEVQARVNQILD